jgi:hypothetical protein
VGRRNLFTLFRYLTLVRPVYFFCALEGEGLFIERVILCPGGEGTFVAWAFRVVLNYWPSILIFSIVLN